MSNEYDLIIEDVEPTKVSIVKAINLVLRKEMKKARTPKGIELDVDPSWSELLLKDGSILRSFEKAGWKVRWMQTHAEGPARGKLVRSWLQFWSNDFAKQVR